MTVYFTILMLKIIVYDYYRLSEGSGRAPADEFGALGTDEGEEEALDEPLLFLEEEGESLERLAFGRALEATLSAPLVNVLAGALFDAEDGESGNHRTLTRTPRSTRRSSGGGGGGGGARRSLASAVGSSAGDGEKSSLATTSLSVAELICGDFIKTWDAHCVRRHDLVWGTQCRHELREALTAAADARATDQTSTNYSRCALPRVELSEVHSRLLVCGTFIEFLDAATVRDIRAIRHVSPLRLVTALIVLLRHRVVTCTSSTSGLLKKRGGRTVGVISNAKEAREARRAATILLELIGRSTHLRTSAATASLPMPPRALRMQVSFVCLHYSVSYD